MSNQAPEDQKDQTKDQEKGQRVPDADEPVTHEEHDPEALEEASEKMLRRQADR
jgi:hypothetical protein